MIGVMAFYLSRGDNRYEPTRATESPWDTRFQHGGPPAALLAHVIGAGLGTDLRLARISVDFLGPIPRQEARIEVSPVKPGRLTYLSEARMVVDGRAAVIARTWHIATGPKPPVMTEPGLPAPLPGDEVEQRFFSGVGSWGYGEAIEWRYTHGGMDQLGRADVWTRVRVPLVDGEELTGEARALIVADSANGLSAVLPMAEWLSIPPAMTTTLLRPPAGEWVHLSCSTQITDDGIGLSRGDLYDPDGYLGEVAQPLLVRSRD